MINSLRKRIRAARKEIPSDLVLKNANVVNVFSCGIQKKDVAIYDGVIVGVGSDYYGENEIDLKGKFLAPGFIDGHLHIESSMLTPSNLAEALLMHGTTTVIADPHEIANVMGLDGIYFMLKDSESIPFDLFFTAPSCVPSTSLETSGASLNISDLVTLKEHPRIIGLAEMMNFPGVLTGDDQVLEKIVHFEDMVLDGHCPGLTTYDLQAYLTAGIRSDHESTIQSEALEKLESGMVLMVREGSTAKNMEALLPLINSKNSRRFCFVSDDLHADDIHQKGHLNVVLRKAVRLGLDPVIAIQLVTLNPSEYYKIKDRGAIAPGYRADIVVLDDLETFKVDSVYKDGVLVMGSGELINFPKKAAPVNTQFNPLNMISLTPNDLRIPHKGGKARIIEMVPDQIITRLATEEVNAVEGQVISNIESDILKLCVVERHTASGRVGLGLVRGFGLKQGAIASSVAHDSHNVVAVGVKDDDIIKAVETVRFMGGGFAVSCDNKIRAKIPFRIAGLMTQEPIDQLVIQLKAVREAVDNLQCIAKEPLMALSFLALPVIPEIKLTDMGLVDVNQFEIVPLFLEE